MEVAVLSPQDCLKQHNHRHRPLISRRKPNPTPTKPPRRKQTSPARSTSPPVMGQIRILKRGEDLTPPPKESKPIPVSAPYRIPDGFYAGSGCVTSPPPSELPVPAFFTKKNCGVGEATQNKEIASQLRRVLKLI